MSNIQREKREGRLTRHRRVRRKLRGSVERPRLVVYRSLNHIYAQIVDDDAGRTLVFASSLKLELPAAAEPVAAEKAEKAERAEKVEKAEKKKAKGRPESVKMRRSREVGRAIAEAALRMGIKKVTFDRGGFLFHGRVAALAEAARKGGLEF